MMMMKDLLVTGLIMILMTIGIAGFSQNAKVIVYRNGCIYGSLAKFPVKIDGKEVFVMKNKTFETTTLAPGKHMIAPKQEKRGISIDAKANMTYVVKYRTMFGFLGARPRLKIMTVEEARADSKFFREHEHA